MTTRDRTIAEIVASTSDADCLVLSAPIELLAADPADENGNGGKLPTFTMRANTGTPMRQPFSHHWIILDLAGLDVTSKSRPILREHNPRDIIGHTTAIKKTTSALDVAGVISGTSESANEVRDIAANGFPWQSSVRTTIDSLEEVEAGSSAKVNGTTYDGPVLIVRKSRLKEISFVALGADDDTSASVAARDPHSHPDTGDADMDKAFQAWAKKNKHDIEAMDDAAVKQLKASYDAEIAAADTPAAPPKDKPKAPEAPAVITASGADGDDTISQRNEIEAANFERIEAIREIAAANPKARGLVATAIRERWSKDRFELEALRKAGDGVSGVRMGGSDITASSLEAAMCLSAGVPVETLAKDYDERTINAAMEGELVHAGLHTLIRATLRANGQDVGIGGINDATIRAALSISAAGGFSTVSVPTLTANIAGKALLASFTEEESIATKIASETDNSDFKTSTRIRLTDTGALEPVNKAGQVEHGSVSDESYTNKVSTQGKILTLTREDIINDDLGAFLQLPRLLGHRSFQAREKAVFTKLLAGIGSHFASGNKNYISGSTTPLSSASLTKLRALFRKFKDAAGDPILVMPRVLLVPVALEHTAMELVESQKMVGPTDEKTGDANVHRGKYQVLASPFIDADSGLSGATDTGFWLFASPASIAAIEIAYLRGRRTPIIETGATDMSTLGVNYRCIYDFGVALQDTRGAAFSKGAA